MNNLVNVKVGGVQDVIRALQNYNTIILKPNIVDNRNVLTQEMMSEKHTKYIIKWNYILEGATINVPEDCIIEFAGGTIDNGVIIGNNTRLIYSKPIDEICKAERQGTWIHDTTVADEEDITSVEGHLKFKDRPATDGMGKVILRKNKSFASQVTKPNTIYVIQYDFVLNSDVTIPENCVLEFDGGSIDNGIIVSDDTRIVGTLPKKVLWGTFFDENGELLTYNYERGKRLYSTIDFWSQYRDDIGKVVIQSIVLYQDYIIGFVSHIGATNNQGGVIIYTRDGVFKGYANIHQTVHNNGACIRDGIVYLAGGDDHKIYKFDLASNIDDIIAGTVTQINVTEVADVGVWTASIGYDAKLDRFVIIATNAIWFADVTFTTIERQQLNIWSSILDYFSYTTADNNIHVQQGIVYNGMILQVGRILKDTNSGTLFNYLAVFDLSTLTLKKVYTLPGYTYDNEVEGIAIDTDNDDTFITSSLFNGPNGAAYAISKHSFTEINVSKREYLIQRDYVLYSNTRDTIYVNNSHDYDGLPKIGTSDYPFSRISDALAVSSKKITNNIVVKGTGIPYEENINLLSQNIQIAGSNGGTTENPIVPKVIGTFNLQQSVINLQGLDIEGRIVSNFTQLRLGGCNIVRNTSYTTATSLLSLNGGIVEIGAVTFSENSGSESIAVEYVSSGYTTQLSIGAKCTINTKTAFKCPYSGISITAQTPDTFGSNCTILINTIYENELCIDFLNSNKTSTLFNFLSTKTITKNCTVKVIIDALTVKDESNNDVAFFDSGIYYVYWQDGRNKIVQAVSQRNCISLKKSATNESGAKDLDYRGVYGGSSAWFNNRPVFLLNRDYNQWIEADGTRVGAKRTGTWSERPTIAEYIYEGFMYMINDGSNHFPIYAHINGTTISWYKADGTQYTG